MKVFWYSSETIYDSATIARLSCAFEDIVVPANGGRFFPHDQLIMPPAPHLRYADIRQPFTSVRERREAQRIVDEIEWVDTSQCDYFTRLATDEDVKFEFFLRTAALNNGVILGDAELSDYDFRSWLKADPKNAEMPRRLNLAQALLVLAGVQIAIPNVSPRDVDEIMIAKDKFAEEFLNYQAYVAELLGGVSELVKTDPSYDDLIKWSTFLSQTKIAPALRRLEIALRIGDRKLAEGIGYGLLQEMPTIVAGQLSGSSLPLITAGLEALLHVLAPNLAQSIKERRALTTSFGLSYLYKIKKL